MIHTEQDPAADALVVSVNTLTYLVDPQQTDMISLYRRVSHF